MMIENLKGLDPDVWGSARWTWKLGRTVEGVVHRREYRDPYLDRERGRVCGFMTGEVISFDDLPMDAYVIIGADVDYVAPGDILSVRVSQISLLDQEEGR